MTTTTTVNPGLVKELIKALRHRPFAPFAIVTRDGKRHRVTRAHQAGTNERDVGIVSNDDRMTWLKMQEISAIQPLAPRRRGGRRGKAG